MDSTERLLLDAIDRLLADHVSPALRQGASDGVFPEALFRSLEEGGYLEVPLASDALAAASLFRMLELAGRYALPGPLAERLLASLWLQEPPTRAMTLGWRPATSASLVAPWGRWATWVLELPIFSLDTVADSDEVVVWRVEACEPALDPFRSEPLDRIRGERIASQLVAHPWVTLARARVALMVGALESTLELTLRYLSERQQFGRPLAKFQVLQHQLAVMASEVAAARLAAAAAIAEDDETRVAVAVAAAKARVGEAAGRVADIAQQAHGAMGYTREHELHQFTTRLWRWRDEAGHEGEWQRWLGGRLLARQPLDPWSFIVENS